MKLLEDKAGIITGGGSGIGRAAAILFARNGAKLFISGRREDQLRETAELVEKEGGEIYYGVCDISVPEQVKTMVETAVEKLGKLDFAFNNAGTATPKEIAGKLIHEIPEGFVEKVMNTNALGTFYCMKYEIAHLLENGGGTIVNNCSNASLYPTRAGTAYGASKHAELGFTRCAALDYADKNIRVNAIAPGITQSPMIEELMTLYPEKLQKIMDGIPDKRVGDVFEQANAALYLLSDMSAHITGQILLIDGGQSVPQ